jgi:hypothetical protein
MQEPDLLELARTGLFSAGAGLLGRMMALAIETPRRPFGWSLVWELPVAVGMGYVGSAAGDWMGLPWRESYGLGIVSGYLGPRVVDLALSYAQRRLLGTNSTRAP